MSPLIVTGVYPRADAEAKSSATKVVHYFAKEWERLGHRVLVAHTPNRLFYFLYYLPVSIREKLKAKTGNEFPDKNMVKKGEYPYDGISVYRRPVFKLIPRHLSSNTLAKWCAKDIEEYCQNKEFKPDLIIGHWETPVVQVINKLAMDYKCRKSIVFHGNSYIKRYPERIKELISDYDAIGARSLISAKEIQEILKLNKTPFVCYSGIPDEYLALYKPNYEKHQMPIRNFIYVGTLITRKNCDSLIKALAKQENTDWHLDIVGDGAEKQNLIDLAIELKVKDQITFHGRVPRDQVIELMKQAQCFIMNSRGEVFGLVYLEAMLANCITVASKNEGMDGVITNGDDGFLVRAGDVDELAALIERIQKFDSDSSASIAKKAYETACHYTDSAVAKKYLDSINSWSD